MRPQTTDEFTAEWSPSSECSREDAFCELCSEPRSEPEASTGGEWSPEDAGVLHPGVVLAVDATMGVCAWRFPSRLPPSRGLRWLPFHQPHDAVPQLANERGDVSVLARATRNTMLHSTKWEGGRGQGYGRAGRPARGQDGNGDGGDANLQDARRGVRRPRENVKGSSQG